MFISIIKFGKLIDQYHTIIKSVITTEEVVKLRLHFKSPNFDVMPCCRTLAAGYVQIQIEKFKMPGVILKPTEQPSNYLKKKKMSHY